jgi:hypothetical protein
MLEVQSQFLRGNMEAFLDQNRKLADIAGRVANGPYEAMQARSAGGPQR